MTLHRSSRLVAEVRPDAPPAPRGVLLRACVTSAAAEPDGAPSGDFVLYLLRQCALFQGLAPEGRVHAASLARAWSMPRKAVLFREGEAASEFCILYDGRVKLTQRTRGEHETLVRVVSEGQACAWPGIVADAAFLATATALEPSRALMWDRADIEDLFDRFPVLRRSAMRVLSRRMRELQDRYRELATERVPQRLARTLLRVVQPDGRRFEDGFFGEVPLSRRDLAQLTGTTLFTVSRLLTQWERSGVLEARRQSVLVSDPHALGRLVAPLARRPPGKASSRPV